MKQIICGILVAGVLLLSGTSPGYAERRGGFQQGGPRHVLVRGGHGHGFVGRFHGHRHVFLGSSIFIGAPFWRGPFYPYPYYAAPTVISEPAPSVYIQQETQPQGSAYWYYCEKAQAYYPYVKECPDGWMTVVPPTATPTR